MDNLIGIEKLIPEYIDKEAEFWKHPEFPELEKREREKAKKRAKEIEDILTELRITLPKYAERRCKYIKRLIEIGWLF